MRKPQLFGISGPSCSGKSTLAAHVAELLGAERTLVVSMDDYYRDLSHFSEAQKQAHNFDEPDAIESTLLCEQLRQLLNLQPVNAPIYDFATSRRCGTRKLEPREYILLEGLFTWRWPEIDELHNLRVFVDASNDVCLQRRVQRDTVDRGRSEESVREQYAASVRPMRTRHLAPVFAIADIVVDGEEATQLSAERIEHRIKGAVQL